MTSDRLPEYGGVEWLEEIDELEDPWPWMSIHRATAEMFPEHAEELAGKLRGYYGRAGG